MVNLTTLAPDIVAAILDDSLSNHITPFDLAVNPPALWDEQRASWALTRFNLPLASRKGADACCSDGVSAKAVIQR